MTAQSEKGAFDGFKSNYTKGMSVEKCSMITMKAIALKKPEVYATSYFFNAVPFLQSVCFGLVNFIMGFFFRSQ